MLNEIDTAPRLLKGSHADAKNAPDGRGPPLSPTFPSHQLLSLLDVEQLKAECRSTRLEVTRHDLTQQQRLDLVQTASWRDTEEADYPTAFDWFSTSRMSAPADLGSFRDVNTVSLHSQRTQDNPGNEQIFIGESPADVAVSVQVNPTDHPESADVTLDADKPLDSPTLVAVGPLDIAPNSFHLLNQSELALSMPYPTRIS